MIGRGSSRRRMTTHSGCSRHAASWPACSCTFCRHVDKQNNTTPPKPHTVSLYTTTHAQRSAAKKKRTRARATRRRTLLAHLVVRTPLGVCIIQKVRTFRRPSAPATDESRGHPAMFPSRECQTETPGRSHPTLEQQQLGCATRTEQARQRSQSRAMMMR